VYFLQQLTDVHILLIHMLRDNQNVHHAVSATQHYTSCPRLYHTMFKYRMNHAERIIIQSVWLFPGVSPRNNHFSCSLVLCNKLTLSFLSCNKVMLHALKLRLPKIDFTPLTYYTYSEFCEFLLFFFWIDRHAMSETSLKHNVEYSISGEFTRT